MGKKALKNLEWKQKKQNKRAYKHQIVLYSRLSTLSWGQSPKLVAGEKRNSMNVEAVPERQDSAVQLA